MTNPRSFYTGAVPDEWNRLLDAQATAEGDDARRVLDDMQRVNATIRVTVSGDDGGTFHLNIASGRMTPGETASHPPFLTLVQDRPAFERLAREAGDSALALLGGLSGLAGEMKLTNTRIGNLALLRGSVRFEVTGERGFSLLTHFGPAPVPDEPTTTLRVDHSAYAELRAGRLDPQTAFMNGKIQLEGDMQLAMQLALAAISPD